MKKYKNVTTQVKYVLDETDLRILLRDSKLIPENWQYFSIEVINTPDQKGLQVTLEETKIAD